MTCRSWNWLSRKREELIEKFGGKCDNCPSTSNLEFAHVTPNEVNGAGRGSYQRYKDVRDNPENYRLKCKPCHYQFDFPEDIEGRDYNPQGHWSF